MPAPQPPATPPRPRTSNRDPEALRARLEEWLRDRLPAGAAPRITRITAPSANGMSSETLLIDAEWDGAEHALVARVEPDAGAVPVFPSYDLAGQFEAMRLVRELSGVPVPDVLWFEPEPDALGAPFFVMQRLEGRVPPDVMPYVYGSWVTELDDAQRRSMQDATVSVLARLHTIPDAARQFAFLAKPGAEGVGALRRNLDATRTYYAWASSSARSPLIERALDWLDANQPAEEGPTVLSWGDSRVGNIMYGVGDDDPTQPVAVLDWEMATLAPPEADLAWLVYMHTVFQISVERHGMPGLPEFLRWDDVAARYAELTGYQPRDGHYYTVYACTRMAIITLRTQLRAVHFGELDMPEDVDDLIRPRVNLEALLDA